MTAALATALLLALGAALGCLRTWRAGAPRRLLRCALQAGAALALWWCLWPPSTPESFRRGELTVLTPGATAAQVAAAGGELVALPGVAAPRDIERAPDLATALRRHAGTRALRVVGGGLPARDRDAARGLVAAFDAAPLPPGIDELAAPGSVAAGAAWRVHGHATAPAGTRIELHDPAGALAASAQLDVQGRFELATSAKVAGPVDYRVRALDAQGAVLDEVSVPMAVHAGERLRLLVLAGAPDAQLKYLRRWALDAGLELDSRIELSSGIALREGAARLDAATLAASDLVIIDERAWAALAPAPRQALRDAVAAGMGLLLRASGPLPPAVVPDWQAWGFTLQADAMPRSATLTRALGTAATPLALTVRGRVAATADVAPLLHDDAGVPLGAWRDAGRGRVGLIDFDGDWRFVLAGERSAHAQLWSGIVARLARARGAAAPLLPSRAQVDQRAELCGVVAGDLVDDGDGGRDGLVVERVPGGAQCAAYWPARSGWHALVRGAQRWPFHVGADAADGALVRGERQRATRALLAAQVASADPARRARPWPRWPFWAAFVMLAALTWWLERPRQ